MVETLNKISLDLLGKGNLTCLAGYHGDYKTFLMLNQVYDLWWKQDKVVYFQSLDYTTGDILTMLKEVLSINEFNKTYTDLMSNDFLLAKKIKDKFYLKLSNIYLNDSKNSIEEIIEDIKQKELHWGKSVDVICLDPLLPNIKEDSVDKLSAYLLTTGKCAIFTSQLQRIGIGEYSKNIKFPLREKMSVSRCYTINPDKENSKIVLKCIKDRLSSSPKDIEIKLIKGLPTGFPGIDSVSYIEKEID